MILLTGATGKTGGETARQLVRKGVRFRALIRDEARAASLKAGGVELVVGDMTEAETVRRALDGARKAFLLSPNGERQPQLEKQFTDLAVEAGVRHVVKVSSMEAAPDAKSPISQGHWAIEEYIRASGLDWTMIRPNFFMQNLLASAGSVKQQRRLSLPLGNAATAMVDTRDVGAACAAVLTSEAHAGQIHEITGPEVLTFHDVADRFSKALGDRVEYVPMPVQQFRRRMLEILGPWHADAVSELFREIAEGGLDRTTDTVKKLAGREPIFLQHFIDDNLALFK